VLEGLQGHNQVRPITKQTKKTKFKEPTIKGMKHWNADHLLWVKYKEGSQDNRIIPCRHNIMSLREPKGKCEEL
jgi:hypothetical protein